MDGRRGRRNGREGAGGARMSEFGRRQAGRANVCADERGAATVCVFFFRNQSS